MDDDFCTMTVEVKVTRDHPDGTPEVIGRKDISIMGDIMPLYVVDVKECIRDLQREALDAALGKLAEKEKEQEQ